MCSGENDGKEHRCLFGAAEKATEGRLRRKQWHDQSSPQVILHLGAQKLAS